VSNLVIAAVFVGVGLVLVLAAPVVVAHGPGDVEQWADLRNLDLTAKNRGIVERYVRTAATLRRIGVLGGLVLPPMAVWAFALPTNIRFPYWTWVFLGYLGGSLYAEVSLVRRLDDDHTAVLAVRDLGMYLGHRVRLAQRAALVVAVVLVAAVAVVPLRPQHVASDRRTALLVAGGTAAFGMLLVAIERWVVRRPQPFSDPDLIAADDVIRATSLRSVAGGGLAVMVLGAAQTCGWLAMSDVQILRWTMWVPALGGFFVALWLGTRFARVPDSPTQRRDEMSS
jgi:hypothetical protein